MSERVLTELRTPTFANRRQRAGWWLIDNQRQPCGNEAWLWLGQAYGGGTGNNMALVQSIHGVPKSPSDDAFRFLPLTNGWWAAYQNPKQYFAHGDDVPVCGPGETVNSHRAGLQFISNE